ncbi:MAG: hypothetical protein KC643_22580 [Nitrospira sp.]|nr:hypothetical protein [Nitrospira sp.]
MSEGLIDIGDLSDISYGSTISHLRGVERFGLWDSYLGTCLISQALVNLFCFFPPVVFTSVAGVFYWSDTWK